MADNEEFIREFLDESYENLDRLDEDFVALETAPNDAQRLASIFRTVHTIKGTGGFFGFAKLGAIAHAGENLLGRLRDGKLVLDQEITTSLLESVDAIRSVLKCIEQSGNEGIGDYRALNDRLTRLASKAQVIEPPVTKSSPPPPEASQLTSPALAPLPVAQTPIQVVEDVPIPAESTSILPETSAGKGTVTEGSIRVDVGLLDRLMNLVGELVLARNQLLQFTRNSEDHMQQSIAQRVNQITTDLQDGVMKTRMQPISNMWSKFPRIVRDLAITCNKEVQLVMEGQETELDRTLLDAIRDPLTHLIRNAVDHGIETPEQRVAQGKPRTGKLLLRAFHEGGLVNIEISDDGRGIDAERVRQKGISRGMISESQAASMAEHELVQLIFRPGFSTAEQVTDVSGRGVGMDVVRTNVERIGGTIDLQNRPGAGTMIRVKIPLTLAIIPALIISDNGQRFAIPQGNLVELLSWEGERARNAIELVHDTRVCRLRGRLLPVITLGEQLRHIESLAQVPRTRDKLNLVVLQAGDIKFGLIVDAINNTEEIVVKPLHPALGALRVYSGATIMGDGQVALILDVTGVAWQAGMKVDEVRDSTAVDTKIGELPSTNDYLLVCALDDGGQVAIPLGQVRRLEEFLPETVERSLDREVVQYRGGILRLVHLDIALGRTIAKSRTSESIKVVVARVADQEVGVVVNRILDVIASPTSAHGGTDRGRMTGIAVIRSQVTDIVDVTRAIGRFI